jgi:hypothetical protein
MDNKTELIPIAKQVTVWGQETALRALTPVGTESIDQRSPPLDVDMEIDPLPSLPLFPTVTHSKNVEQETPARSTALFGTLCVVQ